MVYVRGGGVHVCGGIGVVVVLCVGWYRGGCGAGCGAVCGVV